MKTIPTLLVGLLAGFAIATAQAQLRHEIGKPLQQASELLRAGKAREALAKVREAEAVGAKTSSEQLTIDRMKAAAAQRAGDTRTAIDALESIYEKVSGAEKGQIAEQLSAIYAQSRNNARATEWLNRAVAAGNNSAGVRQLQQYLQSASGDYAAIAKDAAAAVSSAEQAGRRPDEGDLLRLADAQQRLNNNAGYVATLEKLVLYYPKKDYWNAVLGRLERKPGFSSRLSIDVLRLKLATGTLSETAEFMEYAQLALQARLPAESVQVIEAGFKAGALGKGPDADRHQRLKDLAMKNLGEARASIDAQAAAAASETSGEDAVKVGYALVTLGKADAGVKLIEQGIAKGGLKHPQVAKLRLGMALLQQGKSRNQAVKTLRGVSGNDGTADIAKLWTVVGV